MIRAPVSPLLSPSCPHLPLSHLHPILIPTPLRRLTIHPFPPLHSQATLHLREPLLWALSFLSLPLLSRSSFWLESCALHLHKEGTSLGEKEAKTKYHYCLYKYHKRKGHALITSAEERVLLAAAILSSS